MTNPSLNKYQLAYLICEAVMNKSDHIEVLGQLIPLRRAKELLDALTSAETSAEIEKLEEDRLADELSPDAMDFPSLEAVYPDYVGGWKRWAESL